VVHLPSFFNLGARWGGWSTPHLGRFTSGNGPVCIVHEAGRVPGLGWTGAENLAPTGIRSPDRPVRSESHVQGENCLITFVLWGGGIWRYQLADPDIDGRVILKLILFIFVEVIYMYIIGNTLVRCIWLLRGRAGLL